MTRVHPVLAEAAAAASRAYDDAMARMSRAQRSELVGLGGDGTPTYLLDEMADAVLGSASSVSR